MDALQLAKKELIMQRYQRAQKLVAQVKAREAQTTFAVPFVGYRNGVAMGQMPDGGLVPIQASSNGSLTTGQVVVANAGQGGRAIGRWMPR